MKKLQTISNISAEVKKAEETYNYQKLLTSQLDSFKGDFDEKVLLQIILWKLNRYPEIADSLLKDINSLRKEYTQVKAKLVLRALLTSKGFDLPMASTVLRFAVPEHLQIIDQRVYRLITPGEDQLKLPHNIEDKINLYFSYIQRLKTTCADIGIPFCKADRILYQLDKQLNNDLNLTGYA